MSDHDLKNEMENLKSELGKLRADLSGVAAALKGVGATGAGEAGLGAAELFSTIKEALKHGIEEAREKGKKSVEVVEHQVTEHPIISLLAAFGAGFLVAKLLDRR